MTIINIHKFCNEYFYKKTGKTAGIDSIKTSNKSLYTIEQYFYRTLFYFFETNNLWQLESPS